MLPIDVPVTMSTGMPARSNTFNTPICAIPFAPPPLSTTATFFLLTAVLSVCALAGICAWTLIAANRLHMTIESFTIFIFSEVFMFRLQR